MSRGVASACTSADTAGLSAQVLAAAELVASDSGGTSDPFATLSVLEQGGLSTRRTATLKKTLHPESVFIRRSRLLSSRSFFWLMVEAHSFACSFARAFSGALR